MDRSREAPESAGRGTVSGRWRRTLVNPLLLALTALLGTVFGGLSLARDYFDVTDDAPTDAPTATASVGTAPARWPSAPPSTPGATSTAAGRHLDSLEVESGATNLGPLPRELRDRTGYDRPVVITCPSNAGSDQFREVSYLLRNRFVDLTATVRPYFPDQDDRDAVTLVYAIVAVRERDGTLTRTTRGSQLDARTDAPRPLTVDTQGAESLTLRVQCEAPHGVVVLTGAVLTGG